MSNRERFVFVGSVLLSLLFWGMFFSWKFGLILIFSLLIHESGHYWWMGKEGIKKKRMFFIPLLGALAQSKECWPSLGAEARIALAGPIVGSFPALIAIALWVIKPLPIFAASAILISNINLFNLLFPAPVSDGGRVLKTILWSIHPSLSAAMFFLSFILISGPTLLFPGLLFINLVFLFISYQEWRNIDAARKELANIRTRGIILAYSEEDYDAAFAKIERELKLIDEPDRMKLPNALKVRLTYLAINALYIGIMLGLYQATGIHFFSKQFFSYFL